jgi:LmbE family N-acetylglucosaminyl deacetylase
MRALRLALPGESLSVLFIGAHSDDIEIGAGGTVLSLIDSGVKLNAHWCVLSGGGQREQEARASAEAFLKDAEASTIELADFDDSYFPTQNRAIKERLIDIRSRFNPDVIFTHSREDSHQDHREVNQLTWNVFRDHLIFEYEIPKWDGDLGPRNAYFPLTASQADQKASLLREHFGTQRSKDWFDAETFLGLSRLRGMECRAPERHAEAFTVRKARF